MGQFNYTAFGTGKISWAGNDIGYTKGNVEIMIDNTISPFMFGVPQEFQGAVVSEFTCGIKMGLAQISAQSTSFALGGTTIQTTSAGATAVPAANYVTQPIPGQGLYGVILQGGNVTVPVVHKGATLLAQGTDYFVVPGSYAQPGMIFMNPSSPNTSAGDAWNISYSYDPGTTKTLAIGTSFTLEDQPCVFTHTRTQDNSTIQVTLWKCQIVGKYSMKFSEKDYQVNDLEIRAIPDDTNHPTQRYGTIAFSS